MTAPDPRLNEIQARLAEVAQLQNSRAEHSDLDAAVYRSQSDVAFLLAELRKAHEALERVEELHASSGGHNPLCHCGIPAGDGATCIECGSLWPCETRAAVAAAKGDEQ